MYVRLSCLPAREGEILSSMESRSRHVKVLTGSDMSLGRLCGVAGGVQKRGIDLDERKKKCLR